MLDPKREGVRLPENLGLGVLWVLVPNLTFKRLVCVYLEKLRARNYPPLFGVTPPLQDLKLYHSPAQTRWWTNAYSPF